MISRLVISRSLLSVACFGTALVSLAIPTGLTCLQMTLGEKEYQGILLALIERKPIFLILPGLLGASVVVISIIDVLVKRSGGWKAARPMILALVLLNVAAVIYYWSVQFHLMLSTAASTHRIPNGTQATLGTERPQPR